MRLPWKKKPRAEHSAGEIAGTAEYQLLEKLWNCPPGEQRKAHALGVASIDETTLLEVWQFYVAEQSSALARGTNLDTRAGSILAILALFGSIFWSSSSALFQYFSSRVVQIEASLLLAIFLEVIFCSLMAGRLESYYVIFDGYLTNVKPKIGESVGPDFNLPAVLANGPALGRLLESSFNRGAYLRKNVLNLVQVTTRNRDVNRRKAVWLRKAQDGLFALLVMLVLMTVTMGFLRMKAESRTPQRGIEINLFE